MLLVARLVTGLGVGLLTPTATAYLHDLHEAHRRGGPGQRFEIVSTAANIGGLGVGPLAAGVLAQYLAAPLRLPYLVFGGLLLLGLVAVALTPETVERRSRTPPYRPLRVSAGDGDRAGYLAAAVAGFASFAVFGGTLHHPSHALAGLVVAARRQKLDRGRPDGVARLAGRLDHGPTSPRTGRDAAVQEESGLSHEPG